MTELQSMMLSVCFGAVVGTFICEIIFIIKFAIEDRKEKKRKNDQEKQ